MSASVLVRRPRFGAFVASSLALVALACGSRGPLDAEFELDGRDTLLPDGGRAPGSPSAPGEPGSPGGDEPGSPGLSPDGGGRDGGAGTGPDAGRDAGYSGPLGCPTCIREQCSAPIQRCFQSPGCQRAFQCVLTRCLAGGFGGGGADAGGGGGANPQQCFLQCAAGDPQALIQIFGIVQCLGTRCGEACGSLLGGGGGFPGFPGGGGLGGNRSENGG